MNLRASPRTQPDQVERPVELGLEHAVERFDRLVADELVLDQAGAVDQADDFAVAGPPAVEHARQGRWVAHVGLGIGDGRAGLPQALQVFANFPRAAEGLVGRFDIGRAAWAAPRGAAGRARARLDLGLGSSSPACRRTRRHRAAASCPRSRESAARAVPARPLPGR